MEDRRGISIDLLRRGIEFDQLSPTGVTPDAVPMTSSAIPDEPRIASALDAFARRIHRSLDPQEVIAIAVHELRPIFDCERVCYLELRGKKFRFVAASGHVGLPRRSRPASLLEQFVTAILPEKERFLFPDDQTVLPDEISRRLADYWEQTNGQLILVEPVFSSLPDPENPSQSSPVPSIVGALVIEQFSRPDLMPGTLSRLDVSLKHLTLALENSRKYSRLVSIPGLLQIGHFADLIRSHSRIATLFYLTLGTLLMAAACLIKRPFEIECRGRLMPTERREVFSGIEGEIVDVAVRESEPIEQGQLLCLLQSRELQKSIIEQTGLLKGKLKARDAARAELRSRAAPQVRNQTARDQAQLELVSAEIETLHRQLEILAQEEQRLEIRSPISGTVMTERPVEKLRGRPVRRGESLLEIMQEEGGWQLELAVAERRMGHLLNYHRDQPQVIVKFRLLSSAQKSFECQITRVVDRTIPSSEWGSACQIYCDVSNLDQLTRQVGSEVSARIRCGEKSLAYLWFHEFWELLQRNWWV